MSPVLHGPWKDALLKSLGAHVALVLLAWIFSSWSFLSLTGPKRESQFIKSSVKVDVIAMPKLTLKELKALEEDLSSPTTQDEKKEKLTETLAESTPPSEAKKEVVKEKSSVDFMSKLKKLGKRETKKKRKKAQKSSSQIHKNEKIKGLILAGNKLSAGESVTGGTREEETSLFENYILSVSRKVKSFWRLPSYLKNKNFSCRVRVFIDARGELIRAEVITPGPSEEYDQRALQAIRDAAPFDAPQDKSLIKRLRSGDIGLAFPL